ncbi:hypothetical protein OEA41_002106 [Lepraria neglecta]|uniref:Uncharacterized protein n=1 Tax=Lepraria neglecta TaxID=209136 RepID=A0AAD9ZBF8_9LECA|nr:hypothetical protein OEA41_002106 [Lepraria neglecta]
MFLVKRTLEGLLVILHAPEQGTSSADGLDQDVQQPKLFLDTLLGKLPPEIREQLSLKRGSKVLHQTIFPLQQTLDRLLARLHTPTREPFVNTSFGKLPPEIREQIYHELLIDEAPHTGQHSTGEGTEGRNGLTKASDLNILLTCRQIYHEASHIYYARNSFHINTEPELLSFLDSIGQTSRAKLTSLPVNGLVIKHRVRDKYSQEIWDQYAPQLAMTAAELEIFKNLTGEKLHLSAEKAAPLMKQCINLRRICMQAKIGDEFLCFVWLGLVFSDDFVVNFLDELHWVLRARSGIGRTMSISWIGIARFFIRGRIRERSALLRWKLFGGWTRRDKAIVS